MNCQYCQGQTAPGIYLCKLCIRRLEDVLTQIEDALEVADDTIAKQDRMGSGGVSGGSAEAPAPINLDTMEKRRELWGEVVSYSRMVLEEDDSDDLHEVPPLTYLRISMDLIAHQPFAGELLDTLEGAAQKLWRAVDCRPDVIALGQCGAVHEGVPCPGVLRARVLHKDPDSGKRTTEQFVRCRVCGATHDAVKIQQERITEAWDQYDTLASVVKALRYHGYKINLKSAQRWASEGELVGMYRNGVAVYSPGQVRKTHQEMQRKRGRPRKVA